MKLRMGSKEPDFDAPNKWGKLKKWWQSHLLGGQFRTSTLVLIVVFLLVWWTYETYRPHPEAQPTTPPAQVVPPGYVPDPDYTWVPRTRVDQYPPTTTPTPTTTTPTPTPSETPTTTTTSPNTVPSPPCLLPPQFCPPSTTAVPPSPPPGATPGPMPGPTPGPTLPGR